MPSLCKALFVLILMQCNQSFAQGKIVMNGATMKLVNAAYVSTSDLTVASGGSVMVDSSTIKIAGIISNSGIFNLANGTLEMNGTAFQTIPANSITNNILKNLIASNDFSLAGQDSVTGTLSFGASNKTFSAGNFLTLKSTAAATARVADITNGGALSGNRITGNVKIERYINAVRAWRFLTAPIGSSQTINAAWQEGQVAGIDTLPGYGTHITGGSPANGFDQGVNSNIAIKRYSGSNLVGLSNTNTTQITSEAGFMLFFRGNRGTDLSLGLYAPVTSSVLRSTGSLKTNDQSYPVSATGFTVIGNPFASPIDLFQVSKSNSLNIQDNFYLWDPKLSGSGGVGAYVNLSWNGTSYDVTPSTGGSGLDQYVQSSWAFLARTKDGTSPGTLIIKETDKSISTTGNVNRPLRGTSEIIRTNLLSVNTDSSVSMVDGILNSYADAYSNDIDEYDAVKAANISENLSISSHGKSLTVERRNAIVETDTIFLNMLRMKARSYQFEFIASNISADDLMGFLEDSYLHTATPVYLNGTTTFNFTVADIPGSWKPDRFRVVFRRMKALPITLHSIKAFQQDEDIKVQWKQETETGVQQYELEKSKNGQQFTMAVTEMPQNNTGHPTYNWLDQDPYEGNNYYRVKTVGSNGEIYYSAMVKVYKGGGRQQIIVPSRQLANGYIDFSFVNMPAGSYKASLFTVLGQVISTKKFKHAQGSSSEHIELNSNSPKGEYMLEVIKPGNSKITNKIFLY